MKTDAGVWIDHKKAIIVLRQDDGETTQTIISDLERHVRHSGDLPEDQQEHRYTNHLHTYYARVTSAFQEAGHVLILGPGEAKGELRKHMERASSAGHITGFETVDKMTDRQVAARTREHFMKLNGESK